MAISQQEVNKLANEFVNITHSTFEEAKECLKASKYNLESALEAFYENPETTSNIKSNDNKVNKKSPYSERNVKINTLEDIINESSQDEEDQEYFTGGNPRGGSNLSVQNPHPINENYDVHDFFEKLKSYTSQFARRNPATESDQNNEDITRRELTNLLSGTTDEEELIVVFYDNGFVVNDEFYDRKDPKVVEFMGGMLHGSISPELHKLLGLKSANVLLKVQRKIGNYQPSNMNIKKFRGKGQMLGSPCPNITTSTHANNSSTGNKIVVNSTEPTQDICYRTIEGIRCTVKVNPNHHTLHDLYEHIRSETGVNEFILSTSHPPKDLQDDESIKLEHANGLNSIIIQKIGI